MNNKKQLFFQLERLLNILHAPGRDRGWITHEINAKLPNSLLPIGVIKISYIPNFDKIYPTFDKWQEAFGYWRTNEDFKRFKTFHNNPFVAYVHVKQSFRRQGVALALYRDAALWMAESFGEHLRQGDPNSQSLTVWKKLQSLGEPIKKIKIPNYRMVLALDYRE